ncbi:PqqD family protein [Sedimentimonas flavescens]|uniref:PqqD family protein n=1 Tax=Sedimentimonas flavescens TaxID=2851012 RepID=A0ABT2ZV94_9RHOB|nr:PqqD family protein [Sedimentimonas flavescens]MCV2877660.1 PqqD family protein [Sedimentimonas flavescens]
MMRAIVTCEFRGGIMQASIDRNAIYRASVSAIESRLGDETVLLHVVSGTYFGLDLVGSLIWSRMKIGETLGDVCVSVRDHFPSAPPGLETDVAAFMEQLIAQDLIEEIT